MLLSSLYVSTLSKHTHKTSYCIWAFCQEWFNDIRVLPLSSCSEHPISKTYATCPVLVKQTNPPPSPVAWNRIETRRTFRRRALTGGAIKPPPRSCVCVCVGSRGENVGIRALEGAQTVDWVRPGRAWPASTPVSNFGVKLHRAFCTFWSEGGGEGNHAWGGQVLTVYGKVVVTWFMPCVFATFTTTSRGCGFIDEKENPTKSSQLGSCFGDSCCWRISD